MGLVITPLFVSVVVRAYGWVLLLGRRGPVNGLLTVSGLREAPVRLLNTETAVVVGLVEALLPFMVLSLEAVIRRIDPALEEAARGLGASALGAFWRVTLPLSAPGAATGSMLVFMVATGSYATPALLGGSQVRMMVTEIYTQITAVFNWPLGGGPRARAARRVAGLRGRSDEARRGVTRAGGDMTGRRSRPGQVGRLVFQSLVAGIYLFLLATHARRRVLLVQPGRGPAVSSRGVHDTVVSERVGRAAAGLRHLDQRTGRRCDDRWGAARRRAGGLRAGARPVSGAADARGVLPVTASSCPGWCSPSAS